MTNHVIPAAAVEAAAKASYEARGGIDWDLQSDELRDAETVFTRAALEAAAPYMLETGKGKGPIVVPVPRSAVTNLYRTRT